MSLDDFSTPGVRSCASPADSARFGISIARVHVGLKTDGEVEAERLRQALIDSTAQVVIARWPSQWPGAVRACAIADRALIPAGTLTYWEGTSAEMLGRCAKIHDGLRVCPAAELPDDQQRLTVMDEVVLDVFKDYGSHYVCNPLLSSELALQGYQEWARSTLERKPENAFFLVMAGDGGSEPVAVATLYQGNDFVEVLLAGMVQSAQGRGWYACLMGEIARRAAAAGHQRVVISTQAHNVRVQRAWIRAGLRPFAAIDTVHVINERLLSGWRNLDPRVVRGVHPQD